MYLKVFFGFQIAGCLFHLFRAFDRNLVNKHLQQLRDKCAEFAHCLCLLCAIAFVPTSSKRKTYNVVSQELEANMQVCLCFKSMYLKFFLLKLCTLCLFRLSRKLILRLQTRSGSSKSIWRSKFSYYVANLKL